MKVIKNAKKPWKRKTRCTGCTSTLEVTRSDLRLVHDPRDGDYYEFGCPVCKKKNTIAAGLVK